VKLECDPRVSFSLSTILDTSTLVRYIRSRRRNFISFKKKKIKLYRYQRNIQRI